MCVNATVKIITMEGKTNDLTEILTQAINKIKMQQGEKFELDKINLAELERLTGITRAKLRRLKENGFVEKPHGLLGRKADRTVLTGYTGIVDTLSRQALQTLPCALTGSRKPVTKAVLLRSKHI